MTWSRRGFIGAIGAVLATPIAAVDALHSDDAEVAPATAERSPDTFHQDGEIALPPWCPGCGRGFENAEDLDGQVVTNAQNMHCTGCGHELVALEETGVIRVPTLEDVERVARDLFEDR